MAPRFAPLYSPRLPRLGATVCLFLCIGLFAHVVAAAEPAALRSLKAVYPRAEITLDEARQVPRLITNLAAATPRAATHEARARAFLADYGRAFGLERPAQELVHQRSIRMGREVAVRFNQVYQNVPVWMGQVIVVFNRQGTIERVTNTVLPIHELSLVPGIAPRDALTSAWRRVYGMTPDTFAPEATDINNTKLYIMSFGNEPRLVWAVALRHPVATERKEAFVDAQTGAFVLTMDLVRYEHLANVYMYNPGVHGTDPTVQKQIEDMQPPTADGHSYLVSDYVKALNCPNQNQTLYGYHVCTQTPTAEADANSDYLFTPVIGPATTAGASDDKFSEVHLFYHVEKIYDFFRGLGMAVAQHEDSDGSDTSDDSDSDSELTPVFSALNQKPLPAIANFKVPGALMGSSDDLVPFDNAMYCPKGGLIQGYPATDSIIFGQGTYGDFSYDADVIYHEFTHAVVDTTVGMGALTADAYGLNITPSALNEGYADFFSSTYTGDPNLAEYVGSVEQGGDAGLRNLENTKKCPDDTRGESHNDSEYWSGALWAARQHAVASGFAVADFNAAALAALVTLSQAPTTDEAATATVSSIRSWFGDAEATAAQALFTARGLYNCTRAVPVTDGERLDLIFLYEQQYVGLRPYVPGSVQLAFTVPSDKTVTYVRVDFAGYASSTIAIDYLLSSGSPVLFSYNSNYKVTSTSPIVLSMEGSKIRTEGNYAYASGYFRPTSGDHFAPGTYYLAFGNRSQTSGAMSEGQTYVFYHTITLGTGSPDCSADSQCATCETCVSGACTTKASSCEADSDCGDGKTCVSDGCVKQCQTPAADGDADSEGPAACVTRLDCTGTCQACENSVCVTKTKLCATNLDCPDSMECDLKVCEGTCVLKPVDGDTDAESETGADADSDADSTSDIPHKGSSSGCQGSGAASAWLLLAAAGLLALKRRRA